MDMDGSMVFPYFLILMGQKRKIFLGWKCDWKWLSSEIASAPKSEAASQPIDMLNVLQTSVPGHYPISSLHLHNHQRSPWVWPYGPQNWVPPKNGCV